MSLAVDPITVSVVQHRLRAIVEEMGEAMLRTSYSQILNSSRDFSTALCDPEGRLIAQAEHVPIHVGALPFAAKAVHEFFKGTIRPGDVYLLNDPYRGGNHLPDLTAFVPVFDNDRLAFWAINRSHQSDIGGATHGAYNASATEIYQEGIRIPPLQLYEQGKRREGRLRDDRAQCAPSPRLPRRSRGHDRLGAYRRAPTGTAARRVRLGDDACGGRGRSRQCRALGAGPSLPSWKDGVLRGRSVSRRRWPRSPRHPIRAASPRGQRPRGRPHRQPSPGDGLHQLLIANTHSARSWRSPT
jgi:N-methylhydantoinase B